MVQKIRFTKAEINRLQCPEGQSSISVYDTVSRGLGLRVSNTGRKVYVFYRKVHSRPERITLGRFPDLTIEQARGKAAELNARVATGEELGAKSEKVHSKTTLGDLFTIYMERHAKPNKRSWKNDEWQFKRHLGKWKNRKISTIQRSDVISWRDRVRDERGPYAANRALALLRSMLNRAVDWGYAGLNVASRVKMYPERSRTRFLNPREVERFFRVLGDYPHDLYRDLFMLLILTGGRLANVMEMRWQEIDLEEAVWTVPGSKTKSSEEYRIPLVPEVIEILKSRRERCHAEWVFPGRSSKGPIRDPRAHWKAICKAADLQNTRIHDLRRTLGSWEAATGASLPIIGKSLGHLDQSTTQVYARLDLDPVRKAMMAATRAMLDTVGLSEKDE